MVFRVRVHSRRKKFSLDIRELDFDCSGRHCSKCGAWTLWEDFYAHQKYWCKACHSEGTLLSRAKVAGRGAIRQAAYRARKKGLPFDLYEPEHQKSILARFQGSCELTGIPFELEPEGGKGGKWNSPSIDRIKPEKGYVFSNVRIILFSVNLAFSNWGEEQFEQVARAWLARKD